MRRALSQRLKIAKTLWLGELYIFPCSNGAIVSQGSAHVRFSGRGGGGATSLGHGLTNEGHFVPPVRTKKVIRLNSLAT
jgi:hypothetical protein